MTLAIADFRTSILALLDDPGKVRYTDVSVDQALRWALIEYIEAKPGSPIAINGLDGANSTTLAAGDSTNIQVGAAGYCALMRSISHAETINLQPEVATQLRVLAETYLSEFKKILDLYSSQYAEKLALDTAKYAADIALQDAGNVDDVAMETAKYTHQLALDNAKYAADLAAQAAKADSDVSMQAAKAENDVTVAALKMINPSYRALAAIFQTSFESGLANLARRRFPTSEPLSHGWDDQWAGQY